MRTSVRTEIGTFFFGVLMIVLPFIVDIPSVAIRSVCYVSGAIAVVSGSAALVHSNKRRRP